jgi:hypothetical protein
MIGLVGRYRVRMAALLAVLLLATLATLTWPNPGAASAQRVLSVTASPTAVPARDGESQITVRIPADAAGDETQVSLSTEFGAFGSASGPPVIDARLSDVGNDTLGASVFLVSDGRAGATVVRARVGSLVDTVTIRFVGPIMTLRLDQPTDQARLNASEPHLIRLVATDRTEIGAPSARVRLQLVEAPEGTVFRSGGVSSSTSISVTTNQIGHAILSLSSKPGDVRILATSGSARLTIQFQFYGEPERLRFVPIEGSAIETGTVESAGTLQVLLQDERGHGVPNQRIVFSAEGGLVVQSDGDGESPVTDNSGTARVHLDSRSARLGPARVTATWFDDDGNLSDDIAIRVAGPPVALYLRAEVTLTEVDQVLIEEFATSTRYHLYAEVVDRLGQPVAGSYQVRWWPVISRARAQVYPQVSRTVNGVAKAIFDLQHVDGRPQPEHTSAQAWLIAKAQVNNNGLIGNLLGDGVPLRASWNDLTWRGPPMKVSEAVAEISDVVSAAWRRTGSGAWQAWFSAAVPGAVDFTLEPGDSFHLVLRSAALLEQVERR